MSSLAEAVALAVSQYVLAKAIVFDGDEDLRTLTIIVRVDKRGESRTPASISHRTESEGSDVRPSRLATARNGAH